ncbi:MAG: hypothetical protein U9P10_15050 [Thermodesulfobacteriota bacterium]|nr:hypothetical protein [Thermodesulfobacteriota bacterium]
MGLPPDDQVFLCLVHHLLINGPGAVPPFFHLEGGLIGQSIDQPGLPLAQIPDAGNGIRGECLTGLSGVLLQEQAHLFFYKIPHAQRLRLDIECAAAGDDLLAAARMDPVIPDIPHTAQNNGRWKLPEK